MSQKCLRLFKKGSWIACRWQSSEVWKSRRIDDLSHSVEQLHIRELQEAVKSKSEENSTWRRLKQKTLKLLDTMEGRECVLVMNLYVKAKQNDRQVYFQIATRIMERIDELRPSESALLANALFKAKMKHVPLLNELRRKIVLNLETFNTQSISLCYHAYAAFSMLDSELRCLFEDAMVNHLENNKANVKDVTSMITTCCSLHEPNVEILLLTTSLLTTMDLDLEVCSAVFNCFLKTNIHESMIHETNTKILKIIENLKILQQRVMNILSSNISDEDKMERYQFFSNLSLITHGLATMGLLSTELSHVAAKLLLDRITIDPTSISPQALSLSLNAIVKMKIFKPELVAAATTCLPVLDFEIQHLSCIANAMQAMGVRCEESFSIIIEKIILIANLSKSTTFSGSPEDTTNSTLGQVFSNVLHASHILNIPIPSLIESATSWLESGGSEAMSVQGLVNCLCALAHHDAFVDYHSELLDRLCLSLRKKLPCNVFSKSDDVLIRTQLKLVAINLWGPVINDENVFNRYMEWIQVNDSQESWYGWTDKGFIRSPVSIHPNTLQLLYSVWRGKALIEETVPSGLHKAVTRSLDTLQIPGSYTNEVIEDPFTLDIVFN
eukprot:GHVL01018243.1.p1 GENE.GHVL01018243.1~~GHVL01018243.1.p1  ORF type:complete len:612 (+),score=78.79 GHVL01018243.1:2592-4427(+)